MKKIVIKIFIKDIKKEDIKREYILIFVVTRKNCNFISNSDLL